MSNAEIIQAICKRNPETSAAAAKRVVDALGAVITEQLKERGEAVLPGLGRIKVSHCAARTARNPATGATVEVPAKARPKFSPSKALKDALNPVA
jgi:nucleoid DNA-binding protein